MEKPGKIKVEKHIFSETQSKPFRWKDIKHLELEDDDQIMLSWEEPYQSENNSYDGHFVGEIIRMVEETDEQYQKRMDRVEMEAKWAKQRRYQSYLKLKEEFESDKESQS